MCSKYGKQMLNESLNYSLDIIRTKNNIYLTFVCVCVSTYVKMCSSAFVFSGFLAKVPSFIEDPLHIEMFTSGL